jgi:cyclopropane fatty-acyl-phospholipid synthase-like methyltransferase
MPVLSEYRDKKVLDVGLGTGYYTRLLCAQNNDVVGVDRNPHLCRLPIKVYGGDATELSKLTEGKKFDLVLSMWMTEYLDSRQLQAFFAESKKVLKSDGKLITTVIANQGLGFLYVTGAKIVKGINKYCYKRKTTVDMLKRAGFENVRVVLLNSWCFVPWAYLVIAA